MKLSVGLIVLAAMLSLATASPMAEVGRGFATEGHTFAPGAGSLDRGARLNAPPKEFMAPAPALRDGGYKVPPPGIVKQDTHAQEPSEAERLQINRNNLLRSLLSLSREKGTPFESQLIEAKSLRGAAAIIISTAHEDDTSARTLSNHLATLAKDIDAQKAISPQAAAEMYRALEGYLESHPMVRNDYTRTVERFRVQRLSVLGNEIARLHQHSIARDQQMEQMRLFTEAMFDTLPEKSQLDIQRRAQELQQAHQKEAARFEQQQMARANYEARAQANPQYGRSEASDPASLQKETSHENIYTQSAANPAMNAHSNSPAAGSNGFQSTRGSMTGENAVRDSHSQPIAEGQFNGVHHDGSLADRKAATPVTNQEHGSNGPHEYYDEDDDNYLDDEDWDWGDEDLGGRAREQVDGKKAYDFDATKANHDGVKNADPKSIETNNGHRPVPVLSERNHQPSPVPATVA